MEFWLIFLVCVGALLMSALLIDCMNIKAKQKAKQNFNASLISAREKIKEAEGGVKEGTFEPMSGSFIATKKDPYEHVMFKAKINLVFTSDNSNSNENGYSCGFKITGEGTDKYGQFIIEEGYLTCHNGRFYFVEHVS